jgi:predicted ATP-grasp superfamily ATP-dependent carboligase
MHKKGAIIIEGHVQGLSNTRSLGEAGIPVIVVDKNNCIARYSKYCTDFYYCPDFVTDQFAEFLISLAEKKDLSGWLLVPSNDHAVYTISKHKIRLEAYYKIITPELSIVSKIYDKSSLLSVAKDIQIPIPITQYFLTSEDEIIKDLTFPVLTKGRNGLTFYKAVGKKAFLAQNEMELRVQLREIGGKIDIAESFTQELIPFSGTNKTVSFTAFCESGIIKSYWMGIKLREHPLQFGTATFAESVYVEDCYKQSVPLLKALDYSGVCEVEFLKDPRSGEYKLIEINARTWLWVGLAKACGIDYAKMIYGYFYSSDQMEYKTEYTKGVKWINWFTDFPLSVYAILKGKLSFRSYLVSLKGKKINAIFNISDIKPTIAFVLLLGSLLKKRGL